MTQGTKSTHEPASTARMPVAFVPHGGGPWPFVDLGFPPAEVTDLAGYLRALPALPKSEPTALLMISAHWEEAVPTVMTAAHPPLLFDYYGFPREAYQLSWPAPGAVELATTVRELLDDAGWQTGADAQRGFDHGAFVPLKVAYPQAQIPTLQLSLKRGLDPAEHLALGRALAPLREQGVFILGSGMTFHNLRAFQDRRAIPVSETFDSWLRETVSLPADERDRRLVQWAQAPGARLSHPREEHLLPLMVVAGAAGADRGTTTYNGTFMGMRHSGFSFG
ncbi:MAG TPA: class III extradiol ring-cleavage dioxygenase [Polyangiales bacterium]